MNRGHTSCARGKEKRKTEEFEGLFENYITAVTTDYDSDVK
jgi:hypothetical protein